MANRTLEFTHIEKTAGTSIRQILETNLGEEKVYVYSPLNNRFSCSAENLQPQTGKSIEAVRKLMQSPYFNPLFSRMYPLVESFYSWRMRQIYPELALPEDVCCIMGHFITGSFDEYIKEPVRAVLIREPLERMYSQYLHWQRNLGRTDWRTRKEYMELPFDYYAFLPEFRNYQSQALGGFKIEDYDAIGLTQHTGLFIQQLLFTMREQGLIEAITCESNVHLNESGSKIPEQYLGDDFYNSFKEFHEEDYAIYFELENQFTQ